MPRPKAPTVADTLPFRGALEAIPANVMIATLDRIITYANPRTVVTLTALLDDIRAVVPDFRIADLIGTSIDIFHGKRAGMIADLLADPANLPHDAQITMGGAKLHLMVSGLFDDDGQLTGYALQWDDVTEVTRTAAIAEDALANSLAVSSVLQAVGAATSLDDAIRQSLDTVRQAFGWEYGSFWELDDAAAVLKWRLDSGSVNSDFLKVTQEASFARGVGLSGRTWAAMELIFVEDLGQVTDCVRAPVAQRAGVKSGICFPIVVDGELVGTMDFFAMQTLTPSPERLDALRNVGRVVSTAIGRIRNVERQLKLAETMATQGREIGQAANGLKESTLEQLASVNETTAAVAEITQIAREAVSRSEEVIHQAEEAATTYQQGRESLDSTLQLMTEIKKQMETVATTIVDLSERTQAIGDIIASVKDIAEQSNLLALNASIEAARAGDQGRGFAVVATEMRSLADQSKQAANQVRSILGEIQSAANAAVKVAEAGGELVVRGVDQATVSGRHIEALADTIDRSSRAAQQIAASTRQQEVGMDQISEAINQVKETAVTAQAASEQLTRNADSFLSIAAEMQAGMQ